MRNVSSTFTAPLDTSANSLRWRIEEINFAAIAFDKVRDDEDLFYLLVSASLIESGTDIYTRNLVEHYADYSDVAHWLSDHWEPEELQHGAALRRYVQIVWPEFRWADAFDHFLQLYGPLCRVEELEPDRRLEMVARCVVETGTTVYYHTLAHLTQEPILADLLQRIRADEVQHYKHFLHYFNELRKQQPVGRARVARVLLDRLQELRHSDSDVALSTAWRFKDRLFPFGAQSFEEMSGKIYRLINTRLPADQAVRMLLKPLYLPALSERLARKPLTFLALRLMGP